MFKFILNMFKIMFKKKKEVQPSKSQEEKLRLKGGKVNYEGLKWIKEGVAIEETEKGMIIHNFNGEELSPDEIIDIVKAHIEGKI